MPRSRDPAVARVTIAQSALRDGGAWLLSHLNDEARTLELPLQDAFDRERVIYYESVSASLYHVVPREHR